MTNAGRLTRFLIGTGAFALLFWGCASTSGGGAPIIPEGKGHLILEGGMITQVNYYVVDQETEEEVHSSMFRPKASSPSAYERGFEPNTMHAYVDPGIYTITVLTDFGELIEYPDVEVQLGLETHVPVQIGKFMLNLTIDGDPRQMRFLLYDYNMREVIGQGMTSTQVRHFITRPGMYKVRVEQLGAGIDQITDVEVAQGRVIPLNIAINTGAGGAAPEDDASGEGRTQGP